ncbi:galaxin-like [Ostrea edulis]|uniref:galaxin-like n=1 Tax=Ostrea edulis TaxID=37623 RepID=UPI0024AE8DBA|nr:galaxin-like [Ostrea edulis]
MALIDDRKQRYCSDNVQPKNIYVCGTRLYYPNNEICCRQNIISSNGTLGCCGGGSYDKRHQTCCHGKAIQKETEICCQGTVHNINNVENHQCCGRNVYSRTSQLCCRNDVITDKTKTHHDRCCYGNTLPFSCTEPHFNTCGKQPYDREKDLCCNMQIHKGAKGFGRKCCGSGTKNYDPETEECRLNDVKNKTDSHPAIPAAPGPPGSGKPIADKKELQTFGISTASSPEWTPSKMQKFIKDKKIYICGRNGIFLYFLSEELVYFVSCTLQYTINPSLRRKQSKLLSRGGGEDPGNCF